jgi:hypothetical protein
VDETRHYLAFPDGVLHFVCAECTALCCKGDGIGVNLRREGQRLLSLYPDLAWAATGREGDSMAFHNARSGCHFLDADNLCRIHKDHGRALKPSICVLFPFTGLSRIGRTVVVNPHFLCPLRAQVPPRVGEVEGTHSRVLELLEETGLADPRCGPLPALPLHPALPPSAVVDREVAFRDRCAVALGERGFADVLGESSRDEAALRASIGRSLALLGLDPRPPGPDRGSTSPRVLDDLLLTIAPTFRLHLLILDSEGILRALAVGEELVRRILAVATRPPTLQAVHQALTAAARALILLAHGDAPLALRRTFGIRSPTFRDPVLTFAAFLALRELSRGEPVLPALERALDRSLPAADRSILLGTLGGRVIPALACRRQAPVPRPRAM